ncbi:unnamed protein product [Brassicogethes aeneus]|uniref:sn-1-specific diacylglycerol lipase ABHD11 n=1 Tax=Brassicogethes aeneus TaxID=1431903 RepID=A0A9P0AW84_BRAAE|nr:unnamed protein product [Brassicogethes aeneus]
MIKLNKLKLLGKIGFKALKTNTKHLRTLSSRTEILEPVKLSYATYEDTKIDENEMLPPLVVLHGLFGSKSNWASLCKAYQQKLLPKRKIVAVDCRNHGDSPHSDSHSYGHIAVDLKDLLNHLNVEKIALMGHSMGGRAVMLFALKYPELVEKLIVVDISPVSSDKSLNTMPSILAALENAKLPDNIPSSQARANVDEQLSHTVKEKDVRAFLLTNLVQTSDKKYKWRINIPALMANFSNNIAKFPSINNMHYEGPTLFVSGEKSNYVKESDYPEIKKIFPNTQFNVIKESGHWVHSEKPKEFLDVTVNFLNDY